MRYDLTIDKIRHTLNTRAGGVLRSGGHEPPASPDSQCQVCAEELVALALGLSWTDHVRGREQIGAACRVLNDAAWSSNSPRTEALLPLLVHTDASASPGWADRYVLRTVREILPIALRAVGIDASACEAATTLAGARIAAREAAAYAYAYADAYAAADAADRAAAAAAAAERDQVLALSARILLEEITR